MIAKRQEVVAQLREERSNEQVEGNAGAKPSSPEIPAAAGQSPSEDTSPKAVASQEQSPPVGNEAPAGSAQNAPSPDQLEFLRQRQEVLEAQRRIDTAKNDTERRAAEAEKAEAKAAAALKKLEAAKNDPLEFIAGLGMTKPEWDAFLANGGKHSPESQKLKAMEQRFAQMEQRHRDLEAKAEEATRRAALQTEEASFKAELGSYTFIPKLGGIPQIRMKQEQILNTTGNHVSLKEAANQLEADFERSLMPLLKHEDVRVKLGIAHRDNSSADKSPKVEAQNGKQSAKVAPKEDLPPVEPWNWNEKKRRALAQLAQSALRS